MWSRLGVPYHSWRITHAKHHASTSHLTQDQAYVPRDRAYLNLPEFDATKEEILGGSVAEEVKKELAEALADSPIGTFLGALKYLVSSRSHLFVTAGSNYCYRCRLSVGPPTYFSTHLVKLVIHLDRLTVSDRKSVMVHRLVTY